jgi:hypothetical protein
MLAYHLRCVDSCEDLSLSWYMRMVLGPVFSGLWLKREYLQCILCMVITFVTNLLFLYAGLRGTLSASQAIVRIVSFLYVIMMRKQRKGGVYCETRASAM